MGTCHFYSTKNESTFIFRLKTQAENNDRASPVIDFSTHNQPSSIIGCKAEPSFYLCCLTKVGSTTEGERTVRE